MEILARFKFIWPPGFALLRVARALAVGQGHWQSVKQRAAVRSDGTPVPWYTYPAIEYLSQFDWSKARVFEWGCGNSSHYWAQRAATVISVETDRTWANRVQASALPNQRILHRPAPQDYVNAILHEGGKFDVVVIDGKWRHACTNIANGRIIDGGLIVLDNSDRYPAATSQLRSLGFFQVDFNGFGPINAYASTTSVFIRANCKTQTGFAEPRPIAGQGRIVTPADEGFPVLASASGVAPAGV